MELEILPAREGSRWLTRMTSPEYRPIPIRAMARPHSGHSRQSAIPFPTNNRGGERGDISDRTEFHRLTRSKSYGSRPIPVRDMVRSRGVRPGRRKSRGGGRSTDNSERSLCIVYEEKTHWAVRTTSAGSPHHPTPPPSLLGRNHRAAILISQSGNF